MNLWDIINKHKTVSSPSSPLIPLGGFLWLPPGKSLTFFKTWAVDGDTSCLKLMCAGKLLPRGTQRSLWTIPQDAWRYQQR